MVTIQKCTRMVTSNILFRKTYYLTLFIFIWIILMTLTMYHLHTQSSIQYIPISFNNLLLNKDDPPHHIDIVYTWGGIRANKNDVRHRDSGELLHNLRAIQQNIPWFNHIFIITNPHTKTDIMNGNTFFNPNNINSQNNITIITESEIFINKQNAINMRNSEAIEANIHHIPNLSDYYLYLNDDHFIGQPTSYKYFFSPTKSIMIPRMNYLTYIYTITLPIYQLTSTLPCINHKNYNYSLTTDDVPYRNKQSMLWRWPNHAPKAYRKKDWIQFENQYPKFFEFVSSKKERFYNCDGILLSISLSFLTRYLYEENNMPLQVIYEPYWDYFYSFVIYFGFGKYLAQTKYHFWPNPNPKLGTSFEYYTNWIKNNKPLTWCLNDGGSWTTKMNSQFFELMEQQFPTKSLWEKQDH
eukprot:517445_1